ncbi:Regulator of telomere elongation helicase 1 [Desmophyllum pertusum]|uniref:Regulator of telomere elongation helicase 1 homolog n=1 Tax=Desmophyllum pertusum TaxID=174260 RepID=A0A9W9YCT1_9CNID|nr:Regulator of telomere elongation helicase 1 [Desmophyllum pertusum]
MDIIQEEQVHIQLEADSNKKKKNLDVWTSGSKISKQGRTLSYWCFSPGHAMKDLMSYGVRSVVLTSGTLSPINSLELKCNHQMMVGVVTKAPDGATLNSSYQTRFTTEYMTGLGNAIVNFARTVPNGLLVFFPSYPVMNKCLEHWQNCGTWSRLEQHKPLFAEPRGKGDFIETMERFYEKINDPNYNAATFFAVCRGKVSEGLDFADINGRAVVITGLPFPPKMDAKVRLKMSFLDETLQKVKSSSKGLSGRQWYRQQASRAVNQAVGRVIRHKQDFGAILLCDIRFTYPDAIQQLPSWMKGYVKVYKEFGLVQRDLIQFFRTADKMVDKSSMKVKTMKKNSTRTAENTSTSTVSDDTSSNTLTEELISQNLSRRKEVAATAVTNQTREAPVSSVRLKYVYKSAGVRDTANATKQASLIESLTNSETVKEVDVHTDSPEPKERTLSEAIMKRKETNKPSKPKKVIKVVKVKEEMPRQSGDQQISSKAQRLNEAKMYITKVKQALSDEHYRQFSLILNDYKQNHDLDSLIDGLKPLFTRNEAQYPLMLGFSSYIRDLADKMRFFEAYTDVTGSEVPTHLTASLKIRKREESRSENDDDCRVGKKRKTEENDQMLTVEQSRKLTKTQGAEKVCKAGYPSSLTDANSGLLNVTKHLNGGSL